MKTVLRISFLERDVDSPGTGEPGPLHHRNALLRASQKILAILWCHQLLYSVVARYRLYYTPSLTN
jgi:hypothetical protein